MLGSHELQQMLTAAVEETRAELLNAIDEVAAINSNTADILHQLMAESFDRPYLDLDAVALLDQAATSLRHLPDSASQLVHAAVDRVETTARTITNMDFSQIAGYDIGEVSEDFSKQPTSPKRMPTFSDLYTSRGDSLAGPCFGRSSQCCHCYRIHHQQMRTTNEHSRARHFKAVKIFGMCVLASDGTPGPGAAVRVAGIGHRPQSSTSRRTSSFAVVTLNAWYDTVP
jgi:hypothetical protein